MLSQSYIAIYGFVKQYILLLNERDMSSQPVRIDVSDIVAIDYDMSRMWLVVLKE